MEVNSFNPTRLYSTSSENDVDEVFLRKLGAPGQGQPSLGKMSGIASIKNRCISEPTYGSFKDGKKKEDLKGAVKTPALSDSSNALKRNNFNGNGVASPFLKSDCSTIFESEEQSETFLHEANINNWGSNYRPQVERRTSIDFPEPEMIRKMSKEDSSFPGVGSVFEGEDAPDEAGFAEVLMTRGTAGNNTLDVDSIFMRDSILDETSTRDPELLEVPEALQTLREFEEEDEDDSAYPEVEQHSFPSGYHANFEFAHHEVFSRSDIPRCVRRTYIDDAYDFPSLPDDLLKKDEAAVYQKLGRNIEVPLSPAVLPDQFVPVPIGSYY